MALPAPTAEALAHSERLSAMIAAEIDTRGGWISFARYMELALYAPGLGYYMAGARKLGPEGDFITAPEITPLFGQTLAQQVIQVFEAGYEDILEIGAGSGALAASVLEELDRQGRPPRHYLILELSPDLRQRSRDTLAARVPHLLDRVAWLNRLPPSFSGVVLGNEVLDAMPVHLFRVLAGDIEEAGVAFDADRRAFLWAHRRAGGDLRERAAALNLGPGYQSEIQLIAQGFVRGVADVLERGIALFIDYGFPAREYYHPQRSSGTLMCHYRHQAHDDPFFLPGLQDITSHIDFSAMARAGTESGLALRGYANQAQFLINCGITELLSRVAPEDAARYLPLSNQASRLLSPSEMGEVFKVIAFARGHDGPLRGFASGDKRDTL